VRYPVHRLKEGGKETVSDDKLYDSSIRVALHLAEGGEEERTKSGPNFTLDILVYVQYK
jgi:hypothetical protein